MSLAIIKQITNGSIEYPIFGYKSVPNCVAFHIIFTCKHNNIEYIPAGEPNPSGRCSYFISERHAVSSAQLPIVQRVTCSSKVQNLTLDVILKGLDYLYDYRGASTGIHLCDSLANRLRWVLPPEWFLNVVLFHDKSIINRISNLQLLVSTVVAEKNKSSNNDDKNPNQIIIEENDKQ